MQYKTLGNDAVTPIAEAHACSPARIALAWLLAKPVVTSVIIGANRLDPNVTRPTTMK